MNKIFETNFESYPIKTLEEILSWKPNEKEKKIFSKFVCDLYAHSFKEGKKIIVCHDMKGGYLIDRFLNGSNDINSFRFFHWPQIDIFIYFSHFLVTIPPISWINCAHKNGVIILGTFITEHENGFQLCEKLFSSFDLTKTVAKNLANIMNFYKFDGWLINIENKIDQNNLTCLVYFLQELHEACHQFNENSKIIWYDSIDYLTGDLSWQNELNEKNDIFFHVCDGIFLNYVWNTRNLEKSLKEAKKNKRKHDVFVGIDVFGRGCFGGGGLNTCSALKEIDNFNLSVAMFSPGWVHECLKPENFTENVYHFWNLLNLPVRHMASHLPLITSFCQGFGQSFFKKGLKISNENWFNLILQEIQPNIQCGKIYLEDAFDGGGCLLVCDTKLPIILLEIIFTNYLFLVIIYKINSQENFCLTVDTKSKKKLNVSEISKEDVKNEEKMLEFISNNKIDLEFDNFWTIKFFKLETKDENEVANILNEIYIKNSIENDNDCNQILLGKIYIDQLEKYEYKLEFKQYDSIN